VPPRYRIPGAARAGLDRSVDSMENDSNAAESIEEFFARYTGYLSAGDIEGLAAIFNYPSLAVTAMGCLAITEPRQSRDFFSQGQRFSGAEESKAYAPATS